jgi:hypothetical protein
MSISTAAYHGSKQLQDHELAPPTPPMRCPWCKCVNLQQIVTLQKDPDVMLMECAECFSVSASRMPTCEALSQYYAAYYACEKFEESAPKVTVGNLRRMGVHVASSIKMPVDKKVFRILDFGGGDGSVAVFAADLFLRRQPSVQRIDITVVDYNKELVKSSNQSIWLEHCLTLDGLPTASFDFVIASAILEHIPDAKSTLDRLLNLMCPGAVLYVRTPFVVPLLKLFTLLGMKLDFTYPGHLYDLGQAFWENQFMMPPRSDHFHVISSRPSIVETSFSKNFIRTLASYVLKVPWLLFGKRWGFVGGWEIVVERI